MFLDDSVQMDVNEVLDRRRTPISHRLWLHMLGLQRLAQKRIGEKVHLAEGKVIRRAPVGIQIGKKDRIE